MNFIRRPHSFDVVVASNLFGIFERYLAMITAASA